MGQKILKDCEVLIVPFRFSTGKTSENQESSFRSAEKNKTKDDWFIISVAHTTQQQPTDYSVHLY